jgi:hypothetical protein
MVSEGEQTFVAVERWFVRHGIPHFISGYRADIDIWTRALPLLVVAYLLASVWGLDVSWTWKQNAAGFAAAVGFLVAIWVLANLVQREPPFERPSRISRWELVLFVVGPAVPPLLFGERWTEVVSTIVLGLLLLGVIYLITSFGLLWILAWAGRHLLLQGASTGRLLARALPLLLLVVTFFFLTQETWQILGPLDTLDFLLVITLFGTIGLVFLVTRVPGELEELNEFDRWTDVARLVHGTPAIDLHLPTEGRPIPPPLDRRQWINAGLLVVFSQLVQTGVVMIGVGALFVVFGAIAFPTETQEVWTATTPEVLLEVQGHIVSVQLLRVAVFLAVFTGLTFSVQQATDPLYRESFRADIVGEIRQAFAVREAYLFALGRVPERTRGSTRRPGSADGATASARPAPEI